MKLWKLSFFSLLGFVLTAEAQATDGNALLEYCQLTVRALDSEKVSPSNRTSMSIGQCFGMVESTRSALIIHEDEIAKDSRACFPEEAIKNAQLVRIVSKFLHDNPAKLNEDATLLILLAYKTAFPCK